METSLLLGVIAVLYLLIVPASQNITGDDEESVAQFLKDFEVAQKSVFQWIRDEYRLQQMPTRLQRDVGSLNGDTWYKNYQIKECQTSNKSSFCNGYHVKHEQQLEHAPQISELFDDLDKPAMSGRSDSKKIHSNGDDAAAERINDKTMKNFKPEQVAPVSDRREVVDSNYSPKIGGLLNTKQFLAKQQNAIREIEMKHQHLSSTDDAKTPPKEELMELNGNQLQGTSSNSHFPFTFHLDTSSGDTVNGLNGQPQHFDDQLSQKKNELSDELDLKLSQQEQSDLPMLHRVKRDDANMDVINRLMTSRELENFLQSHDTLDDEIFKFLDDNELNDGRANSESGGTGTAKQDTNSTILGDKSECNETMSVNSNQTTSALDDVRIKRHPSHQQHRQRAIKGKQKISDLISGELPNDIIKAVHKLVDANEKLKHHIKPHLSEPMYTKLKDSSKLSSVKIDNMMSDLVGFINEMVDDQIHMRTCIPLTPELREFYSKLMGHGFDGDSSPEDLQVDDDEGERYERFLTPKKRFTRKVTTFKHMKVEEIDEKCSKVQWFQLKSAKLPMNDEQRNWFDKFLTDHNELCDQMKRKLRKRKLKREYIDATQDFVKLESFKNFVIDSSLNDL